MSFTPGLKQLNIALTLRPPTRLVTPLHRYVELKRDFLDNALKYARQQITRVAMTWIVDFYF